MVIKIIWILTGINALALLVFFGMFLASTEGRNVDYMEKGWTVIMGILTLVVLLLAVIPLRFSHSTFSVVFSGFFAVLPLVIAACIFLSKKLPSFKKQKPLAELYYEDPTQRSIATAIQRNDTIMLPNLLAGQDINRPGTRVWDTDGLNYLQFAIRLRKDPVFYPFDDKSSQATIRLLIAHGSAVKPALSEAIRYVPIDIIALMLDKGADPNTHGLVSNDPLLFEAIGTKKEQNDIALLLIERGADKNAKNNNDQTPLMFAAQNSGTSPLWNDCWRVVRFLLENAHADYKYTGKDNNLAGVIRKIRMDAEREKIAMAPDFIAIVEWLKNNKVNTDPLLEERHN